MWLADAVAAYVERLSEREFDAPFTALLHHSGFTNVHFTHGAYEFGKDFIARSIEDGAAVQWCFQSKAGDVGKAAWRTEVKPQIDLMREGRIVHPDFDASLERRIVLVTTGRLKGSAGIEMQGANEHAKARGEIPAELWDVNFLVPELQQTLIAERDPRDQARILEMVGQLQLGRGTRGQLANLSRNWLQADSSDKTKWGDVLTACLLSHEAMRAGREDLAMQATSQLVRAYYQLVADETGPDPALIDVAHRAFEGVVAEFWERVHATEDVVELCSRATGGLAAFVIHPIKVARLCEALSLYALLLLESGRREQAQEIVDFVEQVTEQTPALSHPVGQEWAFSLFITIAVLAAVGHRTRATLLVRETAVWLLDRLEEGRALPAVGAGSPELVDGLLGPYYRAKQAPRDLAMHALAVVTDAAILLGDPQLAADIVHDVEVYRGIASIYVPLGVGSARRVARVEYAGTPLTADHHGDQTMAAWPVTSVFDSVAIWSTYRDRYLPAILRPLFSPASP